MSLSDLSTDEALRQFMGKLERYPLLTASDEVRLAKRIERGDPRARDALILANLRLVIMVAKRYQGNELPLLDLIQEGAIELIRAAEKYDWRRGFRFSTYATWWIRQSVERGLASRGPAIRLPVHVRERRRRVRAAERRLTVRLAREPSADEVAGEAGVSLRHVRELGEAGQVVASLDSHVAADDERALAETIPADERADPELAFRRVVVQRAVAGLPANERSVVRLLYGIGGVRESTIEEVSSTLGVSQSSVERIRRAALARLARRVSVEVLGLAS